MCKRLISLAQETALVRFKWNATPSKQVLDNAMVQRTSIPQQTWTPENTGERSGSLFPKPKAEKAQISVVHTHMKSRRLLHSLVDSSPELAVASAPFHFQLSQVQQRFETCFNSSDATRLARKGLLREFAAKLVWFGFLLAELSRFWWLSAPFLADFDFEFLEQQRCGHF